MPTTPSPTFSNSFGTNVVSSSAQPPARPAPEGVVSFPPLYDRTASQSASTVRSVQLISASLAADSLVEVGRQYDVQRGGGYGSYLFHLKPGAIARAKQRVREATASFASEWETFRSIYVPPKVNLPPPTEAVSRTRKILTTYNGHDWVPALAKLMAVALNEPEEYFREFVNGGAGLEPVCDRAIAPRVPQFALMIPNVTVGIEPMRTITREPLRMLSRHINGMDGAYGVDFAFAAGCESYQRHIRPNTDSRPFHTEYPQAYELATDADIEALFRQIDLREGCTYVIESGDRTVAAHYLYGLFRI